MANIEQHSFRQIRYKHRDVFKSEFPCLFAENLLEQAIAEHYGCLLLHSGELAGSQSLQELAGELGQEDEREVS